MGLQKSVGRMWSSLGLNAKARLNYQRQACLQWKTPTPLAMLGS